MKSSKQRVNDELEKEKEGGIENALWITICLHSARLVMSKGMSHDVKL